MKIKLNDKLYELTDGTTLDMFMERLDIPLQGIAVAVDYEVVPKSRWHETVLEDNMELMMIHAVSGG
ncbi:MAG: sulfur carrier protein ThiS [Tannerella sp.]|jgi:sulfur carrier protein|nr:sulfur carrier protein ThiS [Tannerella sp.]